MQPFQLKRVPVSKDDYDVLIDARSPKEYEQDHIPGAINLPVLNDDQHDQIGKIYRNDAFTASRKGAAIISENIAYFLKNELANYPHTTRFLFYCWRGNQRSRAFAHVVKSVGWNSHIIEGGYRSYRTYIINSLKEFFSNPNLNLKIIAGNTGSGKTILLRNANNNGMQTIDLEHLANHKGSLFGADPSSTQPSQKRFDTLLHLSTQKLDTSRPIYLESESCKIGSVFCPPALWQAMKSAEVIKIKVPLEQRIKVILDDYQHFIQNPNSLRQPIAALKSIRGQKLVSQLLEFVKQEKWDDFIKSLLAEHYDLAYQPAGCDKSPFQPPSKELNLNDFSQKSIDLALSELKNA